MQLSEVMHELKAVGNPQTVRIYRNHGADGELYGVKIADLKKIVRKIRGDQELALQLWDTNNSDAMYLAALVADGSLMTRRTLDKWAKTAWWHMLSEWSVPFVASEHPDAFAIGRKWMKARKENVAVSGWNTYALAMSVRPDAEIDAPEVRQLLKQVSEEIHDAPNYVRYCMNGFVIAAGAYVKPVLSTAKATARKIGTVKVDMGNTSCKVPLAIDAISKIESLGRVGKKKKSTKC